MPREHAPLDTFASVYRKLIPKSKSGFVFSEYDKKTHLLKDIYDFAQVIAAKLIDDEATGKHMAILGRTDFISMASYMAAVMCGNPVVCIDLEVPNYYGQIEEIDAEIVLVNEDRMVNDVDLSEYAKVKSVYTIGSTGFSLSAAVDVTHIENMAEDKSGKKQIRASADEKKKVANFEPKANEAQWVGFNQSSGSTGKPKLQIYRNTVWSCAMKPSLAGAAGMLGFCELVKLAKQALTDNRIAGQVNFNMYVITSALVMMLSGPYTILLMDIKKEETWAPLVEEHNAMHILFYPPQLLRFVESDSFKKVDLSGVKLISCGGGPVTPEMFTKIKDMFAEHHPRKGACGKSPFPVIKQLYGTTELGPGTFVTPWSKDPNVFMKSVGLPPPNSGNQYQIRDINTGELCEPDQQGEVEIKPTLRMFNYYHLRDQGQIDWYKTGDLGYVDKHKNLYIVGRLTNRITLKNATKTNSAIIEDLLHKCVDILDVCVRGKINNERGYDDVHCFIRSSASEETISKWIGENLPDIYDLILHVKNEDLPFLSNGKHDGHKLITGISNAAFTE